MARFMTGFSIFLRCTSLLNKQCFTASLSLTSSSLLQSDSFCSSSSRALVQSTVSLRMSWLRASLAKPACSNCSRSIAFTADRLLLLKDPQAGQTSLISTDLHVFALESSANYIFIWNVLKVNQRLTLPTAFSCKKKTRDKPLMLHCINASVVFYWLNNLHCCRSTQNSISTFMPDFSAVSSLVL